MAKPTHQTHRFSLDDAGERRCPLGAQRDHSGAESLTGGLEKSESCGQLLGVMFFVFFWGVCSHFCVCFVFFVVVFVVLMCLFTGFGSGQRWRSKVFQSVFSLGGSSGTVGLLEFQGTWDFVTTCHHSC